MGGHGAFTRCVEIALQQHGVIATRQAVDAGVSYDAVYRRVKSGALLPLLPGVHRIREYPETWQQPLMAGCLWAGASAVASHRAAARALGLLESAPTEVLMVRRKKPIPQVRLHHTDTLPRCDLTTVQGIPTTTASRTLIDLGGVCRPDTVERCLENALRTGLTSIWHLIERLEELGGPGRNGTGVMRSVLRSRDPRLIPTASELEALLWQTIASSSLPLPQRQVVITDREGFVGRVDFAYVEQRLVIEAQGAKWHLGHERWLNDMERRSRLMLAGWRLLEVAWMDVVRRRATVIARIHEALRVSPRG